MLYYKPMYYHFGIRKTSQFMDPLLINTSEFIFPFNSNIFLFTVKENMYNPTRADFLLTNNAKRVYVRTKLKYGQNTIGAFRPKAITEMAILADAIVGEKTFKFLRSSIVNLPITRNDVVLYNYGDINYMYKYNYDPMNPYYLFQNTLNTVIEDVKNAIATDKTGDRHQFIYLEVPDTLPTISMTDTCANVMNRSRFKYISSYKHMTLLELWKLLTPTLRANSIFNNLTLDEMSKTTLILTYGDKVVLLNLKVLIGAVKEYDIDDVKITKYSYRSMRKLIYILYHNIIAKESISIKSITVDETVTGEEDKLAPTKLSTAVVKADIKDTIVIDSYLDEAVSSSNVIQDESGNITKTEIVAQDEDGVKDKEFAVVPEYDITEETNNLVQNKSYTTLEDVVNEKYDAKNIIRHKLDTLEAGNYINAKTKKSVEDILTQTYESPSPYDDAVKIKNVLDYDKDDYTIPAKEEEIADVDVVLDKTYNKKTVKAITEKYIKTQYKKDVTRTVFGMQNNNFAIKSYTIEDDDSILGTMEYHNVSFVVNNRNETMKFLLPKVNDDGTMRISGNTYQMRRQRSDVVIRKISATVVSLSTYYGKLFISKAGAKRNNLGYWIQRQLVKMYSTDGTVKNLDVSQVNNMDNNLPLAYGNIGRYVRGFNRNNVDFHFEYATREKLLQDKDRLKSLEKKDLVLVGVDNNNPILINNNNELFIYKDDKYTSLGDIYTYLNIDVNKGPIEYANVKIYNENYPVALLLCYYLGLEQALKLFKVKYEVITDKTRTVVNSDQYIITLLDAKILITRDFGMGDMLFYGLCIMKDALADMKYSFMNNREQYQLLFNKLNMQVAYISEIKLLESMFIDPISLITLRDRHDPETLTGLLIKAIELLVTDNYTNPNDVSQTIIRGYERLPGMLYKEMVNAIRTYENKNQFTKTKFVFKPYAVLDTLKDDSTNILVDDLNPLVMIKQDEEITYLGASGRQKISMTKSTRSMDESEIGIVSEATKDSGDVGINSYLTANPKLDDIRGKTCTLDIDKDGWGSILSSVALLSPFSVTDDVKRVNFANIQSSHIIPMQDMRAPYVRTGYESIIPVKSPDKYVVSASETGIVMSVTDKELTVKYLTTGIKVYKLYDWTTKEETGVCYTHHMVTHMKKGDRFNKDDSLVYDNAFFEVDIFNKNRVIFKSGTNIRVSLMENAETFEDSASISSSMTERLSSKLTKVKTYIVNATDNILNIVKIGDTVTPTTPLFTITTGGAINKSGLDDRALSILQGIKNTSPKAKVNGVVSKISVFYNSDVMDMSDSIKDVVEISDNILLDTTGYTGSVNNSYSISGKPLNAGSVAIKIYIDNNDRMTIGDKAIFGNQLKFTVGDVYTNNILTEDGKSVDGLFSNISIKNRIVNSPDLIGTTSSLLEFITDEAIKLYES